MAARNPVSCRALIISKHRIHPRHGIHPTKAQNRDVMKTEPISLYFDLTTDKPTIKEIVKINKNMRIKIIMKVTIATKSQPLSCKIIIIPIALIS